jgi:OPA family glycerol-3-phosphate transporter-like MFS transporter 1/2
VAAELGTHPTLKGSSRALSTVASLIEGTGSVGAAAGPSLASAIGIGWIFYMLVAADVMALLVRVDRRSASG